MKESDVLKLQEIKPLLPEEEDSKEKGKEEKEEKGNLEIKFEESEQNQNKYDKNLNYSNINPFEKWLKGGIFIGSSSLIVGISPIIISLIFDSVFLLASIKGFGSLIALSSSFELFGAGIAAITGGALLVVSLAAGGITYYLYKKEQKEQNLFKKNFLDNKNESMEIEREIFNKVFENMINYYTENYSSCNSIEFSIN